jgi:hypothetical protein
MSQKPNFLVLGAAKSGTTSVYSYLDEHPDVFFSTPKEPVFFEAEYERGLDYYWQRYFAGWSGQRAIGDARSYNLYLPHVPRRIFEALDEPRLIAVLREPGARAYSHWWHRYTRRIETRSFEDALEENQKALEAGPRFQGSAGAQRWRQGLTRSMSVAGHATYLDLGFYAEQLQRYLDLFPASSIRVVLFDDLAADPSSVIRDLWRFLGVDPELDIADAAAQNVAHDVMETASWMQLTRFNKKLRYTRLLPQGVRDLGKRLLAGRPAERPPMRAETRLFLDDYFARRNLALASLIERDLSAWRSPAPSTQGENQR